MLTDVRLEKLAKNLVNYSCRVKKGEKVWIDFSGVDYQLPRKQVPRYARLGQEEERKRSERHEKRCAGRR